MNQLVNCAVVIPCFNEARTILQLIEGVRRHVSHVIVVDDGSTDETFSLAKTAGAECIGLLKQQGKGAALQLGFARARELKSKWVITMDGDGQHSPDDIPRFLEHAKKTRAHLVVGNRMAHCEKMPFVRRWVNRGMSQLLSILAGQRFPDSQCGFRLIRLDSFSDSDLNSRHFEIESEMLLHFARCGERIEFVPIEVIYRGERSKISPVLDALRWFRCVGNFLTLFRREQESCSVIQPDARV